MSRRLESEPVPGLDIRPVDVDGALVKGLITLEEWERRKRIEIRGGLVEKYGLSFLEGLPLIPGQPEEWNRACRATTLRDFVLDGRQVLDRLSGLLPRIEEALFKMS